MFFFFFLFKKIAKKIKLIIVVWRGICINTRDSIQLSDKPAEQAAEADHSWCNSTRGKIHPFSNKTVTFEPRTDGILLRFKI